MLTTTVAGRTWSYSHSIGRTSVAGAGFEFNCRLSIVWWGRKCRLGNFRFFIPNFPKEVMYEQWVREVDFQIFAIMLRLKGFTYTELMGMTDIDREWWYGQVQDYNKREEAAMRAEAAKARRKK